MMVQERFIHFIKQISLSIEINEKLNNQLKEYRDTEDREALMHEYHVLKKELADEYSTLIALGVEDAFLDFIEEEYGDDAELYFLLLEYLIAMTDAQKPVVRSYKRRLEDGLENGSPLYYLLNIEDQLVYSAFVNGVSIPFEKEWVMNKRLAEKMWGELNRDFGFIPPEERDENCIVLAVSGFLWSSHAPTRFVCEVGRILQKHLSKKAVIVNVVSETDEDLMKGLGLPYIISVCSLTEIL